MDIPVSKELIDNVAAQEGIFDIGNASIRELVRLANVVEEKTGIKFIRMEMGVPGLPANKTGVEAEIDALKKGVASKYPMIDGIPQLKTEVSLFVKNFINQSVSPRGCIPAVGAMQAAMAAFMLVSRADKNRNTTLFIDPGFPVQKLQHKVLALPFESFDIYNYRGEKLEQKLRTYLEKGNISSIIYSNPNNPSWICLTETELEIIGRLANEYDAIVIEDLAYFGMDFRKDLSMPGKPPYQASVSNYTDNYMLLLSCSKVFSYAGQRIASLVISDKLFMREYPNLQAYFQTKRFGNAAIYGALYSLSAGTAHSAQYAMAAMLQEVNEGKVDLVEGVKEYEKRARLMKKVFKEHGFYIVYDKDGTEEVADGFYFTLAYPGMSGRQLIEALFQYGISAISLDITGSERTDGLRACVSQIQLKDIPELERRVRLFHERYGGLN